jgi:DNA-binding MarR family transcriptional regulator
LAIHEAVAVPQTSRDIASVDVTQLARDLRVMAGQLARRIRTETQRGGLSELQFSLLARIERDGPSTQAALAAEERISPQAVAQALTPVESDGLITRRPHQRDRRVLIIELTEPGRLIVHRSRQSREAWLGDLLASKLDEPQRRAVADGVAALNSLLQTPGTHRPATQA